MNWAALDRREFTEEGSEKDMIGRSVIGPTRGACVKKLREKVVYRERDW